jgi:hypothetical protein
MIHVRAFDAMGSKAIKGVSAEEQLAGFIARYTPEIADQAHEILAKMRTLLPGATELVYDNYNALAIGWGPSERMAEVIFSIALFPRWVSLFFFQGVRLPDPHKRLKGNGRQARHIVLEGAESLDDPVIRALIKTALERAVKPLDPKQPSRLVIKSISAKQRPRRPN